MTKQLEIRDVQYRSESSPNGWSVRYNADGEEEGWSRLGYEGENTHLLSFPTVFYVNFDRNGVPQRFIDCDKRDGEYWAQKFGYADAPKCNNPEPEATPAAESLTDITRRFCR